MAIDFMVNIVTPLYASDVATAPAYESPGTFGLPTGFGSYAFDKTSAIVVPGTGYVVGDIVTIGGGTSTTAAQIRVATVTAGAVTAYTVHVPGVYTVLPSNPVSTTGGTGTGLEFTALWDGFAAQRILTFIEIMRSYMAEMTSVYEQKLFQTIMRRMLAEMRFGYTYNAVEGSTKAQAAALNYIAGNEKGVTGSNLDYGTLGVHSEVGPGY
jgi:hypothetical protein